MLFQSEQFKGCLTDPASWSDHVFRYSAFAGISTEGAEIDSAFLSCKIDNCEWYWGLFNLAIFVEVTFEGCTFRGASFAGCKFIECKFSNCQFLKDNLGGDCSFDDVVWYGCSQTNCTGLPEEVQSLR
jgi:uncharacterized protein YjbI with pentapeptide repeats